MKEIETYWQRPLQAIICESCDWSYLISVEQELPICPHCYRENLVPIPEESVDRIAPPELVLPFVVSTSEVETQLNNFSKRFYFSPKDLQAQSLIQRLRQVYVPAWIVDSDVTAVWQAEAGFDYQVVSHQESFVDGRWQTREVQETKVRWEVRKGRLQRHYDNVRAPALDAQADVRARLGSFESDGAQPYVPEMLKDALVRLPNRDPQDAWPDTHPTFKALAAEECRAAAGADHIRQYKWQAEYAHQNWSLLLLPVFSTWYYDDEGRPQPVLFNGRTGQIWGVMRASMQRAKRATTIIAVLAALLFLLTLILLFVEPSLAFLTAVLGFGSGLGAIWPVVYVSRFNRRNDNPQLMENSPQLTA